MAPADRDAATDRQAAGALMGVGHRTIIPHARIGAQLGGKDRSLGKLATGQAGDVPQIATVTKPCTC
jgi:hypothetical protein